MKSHIPVLIAGLPGRMAAQIVIEGLKLPEIAFESAALSSAARVGQHCEVAGRSFELCAASKCLALLQRMGAQGGVVVDFTTPNVMLENAALYVSASVPFVMGTSGGDIEGIRALVANSSTCAVLAPNMASPLIALMAAFEHIGQRFPDVFSGFSLGITESHQSNKRDTSATARAMLQYFQHLGISCEENQIVKLRDEGQQRDFGVPAADLKGHAYHTYRLSSPDGSVEINLQHNVRGRAVYALGALQAVLFLKRRIGQGHRGQVYSMTDVLEHREEKLLAKSSS